MDEREDCFVKIIKFDPTPKSSSTKKETKIKVEPPPKTKRVVAQQEQWEFAGVDLSNNDFQRSVADSFREDTSGCVLTKEQRSLVVHQIKSKMCGYRAQDIQKNILDEEKFVTFSRIIELFVASELKCFYCRDPVRVVYEYVREPRQWTLERIDNKMGHNRDNVEIACLNCNLRRRTIRCERYIMTKQMRVVTKI